MIQVEDVGIFNALIQIQRGGKIDMLNVPLVVWYLKSVKEEKAADWVLNNRTIYLQGILEGFKNNPVEIRNIVNKNGI